MSKFDLIVFGPAEGAVAFSFPLDRRINDDSLFLPSSAFALRERATILRISRKVREDRHFVRVAIYRQVFERQLKRLGHSFGAAFDFGSTVPRGEVLLTTIGQVLALVEGQCVTDHEFCDLPQFTRFLSEEIAPSYAGVSEALFVHEPLRGLDSVNGLSGEKAYFSVDALNSPVCSRLLDWLCSDPAGLLIEDAILAAAGAGEPGPKYRVFNGTEPPYQLATEEFYSRAVQAQRDYDELAQMHALFGEELTRLRSENARFRAVFDSMSDQLGPMRGTGSMVERARHPNAPMGQERGALPPSGVAHLGVRASGLEASAVGLQSSAQIRPESAQRVASARISTSMTQRVDAPYPDNGARASYTPSGHSGNAADGAVGANFHKGPPQRAHEELQWAEIAVWALVTMAIIAIAVAVAAWSGALQWIRTSLG